MSISSLHQILQKTAEETVEQRVRDWMKYKFEKEMLPDILREVTGRVRVELVSNADIPEEIVLRVRFEK